MWIDQATFLTCLLSSNTSPIVGSADNNEKFEFTRNEPGNQLGITTKVIAHIHRPAKTTTERWTLNREFTPNPVIEALNSSCSKKLIDPKLKWTNCALDKEGFSADLTHGRPETKNKTFVYLAMSYKPFKRNEKGNVQICTLAIVEENPVYFLIETFSKIPTNDSIPKKHKESSDAVHIHMLGKFGKEFLSIYGDIQDGIYNFDVMDYYERDQLYECFLSIGSSESVSVIEDKCPIHCLEQLAIDGFENHVSEKYITTKHDSHRKNDEIDETETLKVPHDSDGAEEPVINYRHIYNEL